MSDVTLIIIRGDDGHLTGNTWVTQGGEARETRRQGEQQDTTKRAAKIETEQLAEMHFSYFAFPL